MAMSRGALLAGLLLAACVPVSGVDLPPAGTAVITISQGGPFNGGNELSVYQTDVARSVSYGPFDQDRRETVTELAPGTYDRLAAMLAVEGPRARAQRAEDGQSCVDYGADVIDAKPPVGGFSGISSGCPDPVVTALIQRAYAVLVRP